jgi:superfamily II DNA or RNA helicase
MDRWPNQIRGVEQTLAAFEAERRHVLLTSPTGTGKSRMVCDIIDRLVEQQWYAVLYTNRQLLVDQLRGVLDVHGIDYGVRAAGHDNEDGRFFPVQISSLPTELSRVLKRKNSDIHGRGRKCVAIVDEAHLNDGPGARKIFGLHDEAGHVRLGITATPIGLGGSYEHLVIAGTVSDGRACGALVPAQHWACDAPDLRKVKGIKEGKDLTEKQNKSAIMRPGLFGRIWANFEKINPAHLPTVCFGPDVEGSLWIAQQMAKKGLRWAHIDGDDIWLDGNLYKSDRSARAEVLAMSKAGDIIGICTRFILREGVDCPWFRHGIFATVFGAIGSYLQSGGRLLRADQDPETIARFGQKASCSIQDHGDNRLRHGGLNTDRVWHLEDTPTSVYCIRADQIRNGKLPREFTCPQCHRTWNRGPECKKAWGGCGFVARGQKIPRPVVTSEGELVEITTDPFQPRRVSTRPQGPKLWEQMIYRAHSPKWRATFRSAEALFCRENRGFWPSRLWPLMPLDEYDFFLPVARVPVERLRGDPDLLDKLQRFREKREAEREAKLFA